MPLSRFAYALALLCSNAAACELPALAVVPATSGDGVASVLVDVRRYSDSIVEYMACLQAELSAAGGDAAPADLRSTLAARNNYAAAEHKAVTDLYTERVGPLANLRLAEYLRGESRDCLIGSSIVRTGVVNEGAVVFFLRGKQAYLNVLETACPELARAGDFFVGNQAATGLGVGPGREPALQTPLVNRVCDQDSIFPFREGSSRRTFACPLGRFFPVTEDAALQILTALGGSSTPSADAERR